MIRKIIRIANQMEELLLTLFILVISLLVVIQILLRAATNINFYWLEESGRHALVFITFLGSSLGVKYASHFSMTAFETILTRKTRSILRAIVNLACCIFFVLIVYFGFDHVFHLHKYEVMTATLQIPLYVPYFFIPFFSTFISVRFFIVFLREVRIVFNSNKEAEVHAA